MKNENPGKESIFYAEFDTSRFSFRAVGNTEAEALKGLRDAVAKHTKENGLEPNWFEPLEYNNASTIEMKIGSGYRDYYELTEPDTEPTLEYQQKLERHWVNVWMRDSMGTELDLKTLRDYLCWGPASIPDSVLEKLILLKPKLDKILANCQQDFNTALENQLEEL